MLFFFAGLGVGLLVSAGLAVLIWRQVYGQIVSSTEEISRQGEELAQETARIDAEKRDLAMRLADVSKAETDRKTALETVARLTEAEAKAEIVASILDNATEDAEKAGRTIEEEAVSRSKEIAKQTIVTAIERCAVQYVSDATSAVIELPSEDMKGRIIGREGRNIRSFEQITGVDLVVDETPEAVIVSSFDPIRREIARITLMNLMLDGRIHPARIEELHLQATQEVERLTLDAGGKAAERAGVGKLPVKVIEALGKLRFRTSYAQNVLDHSVEVAVLAENLANELGLNVGTCRRAGLLHDIGKSLGDEWDGPHAIAGMDFLRAQGEKEPVLNAVGSHHHDIEPNAPESQIVIVADALSAARPGARRESLDNYLKRLAALEVIANSFKGVERSYAVQAGREIRLVVKPSLIDDDGAKRLAQQVARVIEQDPKFSVQVKVTVIREMRASAVAKKP